MPSREFDAESDMGKTSHVRVVEQCICKVPTSVSTMVGALWTPDLQTSLGNTMLSKHARLKQTIHMYGHAKDD